MPELPEVETIRRDLEKKIINERIEAVVVNLSRTVKTEAANFKRVLTGNRIKAVERVGKLLIFRFERGNRAMLVHLKMTGQLVFCRGRAVIAGGHSLPKLMGCLPNNFTRVYFVFKNGGRLFFNDQRTFGYIELAGADEVERRRRAFGPDPLGRGLTVAALGEIFSGRKASVKAVLLDQRLVAGIGNIYADEILFAARVDPRRPAGKLAPPEIARIRRAAGQVLKAAIRWRGTTFNDFVDADGNVGAFVKRLKVYGRAGQPCRRCGGAVMKAKVAGRGTSFCPACQK